ncbi:MAG TPA: Uma2 family endonuclease [Roseiflexaceae bacterium]
MAVLTPRQITITLSTLVAEPITLPRPGRPWTVADLLARSDEENRYELVRGDLIMMSPASPAQGRYAGRLTGALSPYVDDRDLGEVYTAEPGFQLQPEPDPVIRAPDVAFVRKERIPPAEQQSGYWPIAPDLAVEIISPSETATSIQDKVQDYLAAGTQLIWLVFPSQKIVVEHHGSGQVRQYGLEDSLDGAEVIPGFRYALKRLFRER